MANIFNADGSMNYEELDRGHRKSWEMITAKHDAERMQKPSNRSYELPIRRNSEIELYPDGSLKRYKY